MRTDAITTEKVANVLQCTLDRPIAFHRVFVTLTGSVTAALMLSQSVYWTKRGNSGGVGWFYKTITQWEEETGLSRNEQQTARKTLRRFSFWQEKLRGVPAQMFYRVDMTALYNELLYIAPSCSSTKTSKQDKKKEQKVAQSSLLESGKLDCGIPANKNARKRQTGMSETGKHYSITETTTEITTETTSTTPLSPLQTVPGHAGGRDFVIKLLVGTILQNADPGRIANVAAKYKRTQEEIETAIDVLDQQYCQSNRTIDDPTALVVSALKYGVDPPEGYVPKSRREADADEKRESARKKADEKCRATEAEEAKYQEAKKKLEALSEEERDDIFGKAKLKLHSLLRNSPQAVKASAIEMMVSRARAPNESEACQEAP